MMGSQFSVKDAQWVHPSSFISCNKTHTIIKEQMFQAQHLG